VFIPLYDGVKLVFLRRPWVTLGLVIINIVLFGLIFVFATNPSEQIYLPFGLIPAALTGSARLAPALEIVPAYLTPVTSLFIHGSFWHLAANAAFIWVFGDNVEDAMGSLRFLLFFILCGIISGLVYVAVAPQSQSPVIGASGAVSAVASAYILLYPRARILGLLANWIPLAIPAIFAIAIWAAFQLIAAFTSAEAGVAWWAHIGGIAAGLILLPLFKRREVPLLGARTH